jgi:hypothetical protein
VPSLLDHVLPRRQDALSGLRPALSLTLPATLSLALLTATALAQSPATHDIPVRGAHVWTRERSELQIGAAAPPPGVEWVIQSGEDEKPHRWSWLATTEAPAGSEQPGFADSQWPLGVGEFGPDAVPDDRRAAGDKGERANTDNARASTARQRTEWRTPLLCLRTRVDLGKKKPKALWFEVDHDDSLRIWWNGRSIVDDKGYGQKRWYFVSGEALDAWQSGLNTFAVHCTNIGGYQLLDVRMAMVHQLPAGARSVAELPDALRKHGGDSDRTRGDLFGGFRAPPLLLDGELDGKRQCMRLTPGDLRDVAFWLAMDLRQAASGGVQVDLGRMFRLGDLLVRGRAGPVAADGWQQLELTIASPPEPLPRGDSKRWLERFVRPQVLYGFDGTVTIRRRLSSPTGPTRVLEFDSVLQGLLTRGKEGARWLLQHERCHLTTTHDGQDGAFRAAVALALDRGTQQLRRHLRDLQGGDLAADPPDADRSYQTGRLALGLLALVKGGIDKQDEVVQQGFAELRQRRVYDTYSLGNAMLALDALYAPTAETSALRTGDLLQPTPRTPTPADRELLQRWLDQLLGNTDRRVDADKVLRFHYIPGDGFDNSVTQYGLLGLHAARLGGLAIPAATWEAAIQHWLACQATAGPKVDVQLLDFRTVTRRQLDPAAAVTGSSRNALANGWHYVEVRDDGEEIPARGSMTCAAITGLAIAQAGLQAGLQGHGGKRSKLMLAADQARTDGFAWLAQHMTPRYHPGNLAHQQQWIYYYLYSLERAALLSNVAWINQRDWYLEGALVLALTQLPNGDWPEEVMTERAIERDAMAILFLAQSSRPVITGK